MWSVFLGASIPIAFIAEALGGIEKALWVSDKLKIGHGDMWDTYMVSR